MNKQFFKLPENTPAKVQQAFRYATIIMLATFVTLLFEVYLALRTDAWQLWGAASTVLLVFIASYSSLRLIRNGKAERAAQYVIYSILIAVIATPFLIADIGISLALAGAVLIVELASRTMERMERYVIAGFMMATLTILLDLLLPDYRLTLPELQLFTPVITGVVVIILGVMTWRGFQDYNLRTKLIIINVATVIIAVAAIAFLSNRSLTTNLTENVGSNMYNRANSVATGIDQVIDREYSTLKTLAFDQRVRIQVEVANLEKPLSQSEIKQLDDQWRRAGSNDLLVAGVLQSTAAPQLRQFQNEFPQNVEVFLTNQQGMLIAATNLTSDYYQADEEWWRIAITEGVYIGPPEYDESSKTTSMIIAVSVREQGTKDVGGVLRTTVILDTLTQVLGYGKSGQTGQAVVYLPDGQEIALEPKEDGTFTVAVRESGFDAEALSQARNTYFEIDYNQVPMLASQYDVAQLPENAGYGASAVEKTAFVKARAVANLHMRVIVFQDLSEALQPVERQTRNIVVLAFVIFIAVTLVALGLAQIISGPLVRLNAVAERVAAGDLAAQATVETGDETGTLAATFNAMTTQLRDLIGSLEQRVAARTKALATSAEVSRNLSTILNERQLIVEVVEQLKAAFDYYHVHIYLLDKVSGDLLMSGGTGDVGAALLGAGHKVPRGRGLVGRAAENNLPILVSDTTQDPSWLPNPLLPETKSEVAVPIATAQEVLGVLDVQQNEIGGLKQEDVDLLQSLANQIAIALMNARSYVDIQQRAEREARIISIGTKIKSATTVEAALQTTARELGRTLGTNNLRVILEAPGLAKNDQKPD